MELGEARALFPILRESKYLFSGGHSPVSTPAREAIRRFTDEWTYDVGDLYERLHKG
jgi:hypothetical protein